jgi:hypothetical protein
MPALLPCRRRLLLFDLEFVLYLMHIGNAGSDGFGAGAQLL